VNSGKSFLLKISIDSEEGGKGVTRMSYLGRFEGDRRTSFTGILGRPWGALGRGRENRKGRRERYIKTLAFDTNRAMRGGSPERGENRVIGI